MSRNKPLVVVSCLTITVIGLLIQFSTYLNHDIAWVLYSTRWMMSGEIFGQDVIAANPPLIWYLSYPVVSISSVFDLRLDTAFRIVVSVTVIASALWSRAIIQKSTFNKLANTFMVSTFLRVLS
ncbi:hypothetical protein OAF42_01965 [Planctomicrobium sp.]|nr:hypothetical protein [Planctomicrobium sp.]MDB4733189.1 hypothetical protein [Planctomicrobium sp.]